MNGFSENVENYHLYLIYVKLRPPLTLASPYPYNLNKPESKLPENASTQALGFLLNILGKNIFNIKMFFFIPM